MRKILVCICIMLALATPVSAMDYTAPEAPEDAEELLPVESGSFGKDLWTVVTRAVKAIEPSLAEAAQSCVGLFAVAMLISVLKNIPGKTASVAEFVGVLAVAALLIQRTDSLISLAAQTITELSDYGKLLIPVMAAALASEGGVTSATAMYAGTTIFDSVLISGISRLLVPMVYIFLALSIAASASGESMLSKLRDCVKWLATWSMKTVVYIFTGYMSITGVVSGATDAATVKATKLTMSGMIPVVGSILSDASEAVLVSAGVMKSAVGVYGLLALIAIWISPFLTIGLQYLLLKLTAGLCELFEVKAVNSLIKSFSTAMGLLLGMTGAVCILLLISTVCFMKGVT